MRSRCWSPRSIAAGITLPAQRGPLVAGLAPAPRSGRRHHARLRRRDGCLKTSPPSKKGRTHEPIFRQGVDRRIVLGGLGAAGRKRQRAPSRPRRRCLRRRSRINIIDVGGALALMQQAFDDYHAANPKLVSRITYVKAPAPELAEQDQGAAGCRPRRSRPRPDRPRRRSPPGSSQNLWLKILPDFNDKFPNIEAELRAGGAQPAQGAGRRLRHRWSTTIRPAR